MYKDREAGQEHRVQAQDHELPAGGEHAAPVRSGGLGAEAQEGQARGDEDLRADVQAERHHHRRGEMGHHVSRQDEAVGAAERARRLHEFPLAHGEDHAPDEARVDGEAHDGDGDHGVAQAGAEPGHDGDGEEDEGKGHEDVGEPHDERLSGHPRS